MTPRDPYAAALAERAERISERAHKRLDELDQQRRPVDESPEFRRKCDRLANLRVVRVGLTNALRRGRRSYVTTVTVGGVSTPVAFAESGWYTQKVADARLASQKKA